MKVETSFVPVVRVAPI